MGDFNVNDYISQEQREEIAKEAFRDLCLAKFRDDSERIFTNAAHHVVMAEVNKAFDGKAIELVAENAKRVIGEMSTYTVFNRKDHWEKEDSEGFKVLNAAIKELQPVIKERLSQIIASLDEKTMREELKEQAVFLLDEKLFGKVAA